MYFYDRWSGNFIITIYYSSFWESTNLYGNSPFEGTGEGGFLRFSSLRIVPAARLSRCFKITDVAQAEWSNNGKCVIVVIKQSWTICEIAASVRTRVHIRIYRRNLTALKFMFSKFTQYKRTIHGLAPRIVRGRDCATPANCENYRWSLRGNEYSNAFAGRNRLIDFSSSPSNHICIKKSWRLFSLRAFSSAYSTSNTTHMLSRTQVSTSSTGYKCSALSMDRLHVFPRLALVAPVTSFPALSNSSTCYIFSRA